MVDVSDRPDLDFPQLFDLPDPWEAEACSLLLPSATQPAAHELPRFAAESGVASALPRYPRHSEVSAGNTCKLRSHLRPQAGQGSLTAFTTAILYLRLIWQEAVPPSLWSAGAPCVQPSDLSATPVSAANTDKWVLDDSTAEPLQPTDSNWRSSSRSSSLHPPLVHNLDSLGAIADSASMLQQALEGQLVSGSWEVPAASASKRQKRMNDAHCSSSRCIDMAFAQIEAPVMVSSWCHMVMCLPGDIA